MLASIAPLLAVRVASAVSAELAGLPVEELMDSLQKAINQKLQIKERGTNSLIPVQKEPRVMIQFPLSKSENMRVKSMQDVRAY